MDIKIAKYDEKRLNAEIMAVKSRRTEHKKALDDAKKELSKYDDTAKTEKGQGETAHKALLGVNVDFSPECAIQAESTVVLLDVASPKLHGEAHAQPGVPKHVVSGNQIQDHHQGGF